jgi:type IV pilus assembly protein PilF
MRAQLLLLSACLALAITMLPACSGAQRNAEQLELSEYHYQLSVGHYRAREVPYALRELLTAIDLNPENTSALYLLGFIYQGRRDFEMAEQYYLQALALDPELHEVKNNLGTVYLEQSRWEEAVTIFRELTRTPTYMTPEHALNNLGWAQYNLGMYRDALTNFQMAVEFGPDHCLAWNNQGLAFEALGNVSDARRAYEQAIRRCDDYPEPNYNLAIMAMNVDENLEEATVLFEACVAAAPDSAFGTRCQEYLNAMTGE